MADDFNLASGIVKAAPQDAFNLASGVVKDTPAQPVVQPTPPQVTKADHVPTETPTGNEDWISKGISGPLTILGQLLRGKGYVGSKEEAEDLKLGIHPGPLNLQHPSKAQTSPLFDIAASTGAPKGIPSGIADLLSGFTSPQQLPLAFAPGSKVISGAFAAATPGQVIQGYEKYKAAEKAGDKAGMMEAGTEMATSFLLGAMASYHAGGVGEPLAKGEHLSHQDTQYLTGMIQQHLENSLSNGDHAGVEEAVGGMASILDKLGTPKADRRVAEGESPTGIDRRSVENTPQGQAVIYRSMLEETIKSDRKALEKATDPDEIARLTLHMNDFKEMLDEPSTQQAKANIPLRKERYPSGQPTPTGSEAILTPETQKPGEENLRDNLGAAGGEGHAGAITGISTGAERVAGASSEGDLRGETPLLLGSHNDVKFVGSTGEPIKNEVPIWDTANNTWSEQPSKYPYGSYFISMHGLEGKEVGGLLMGLDGKGNAFVNDVSIDHPDYLSKGYGKALYKQAIDVVEQLGAEKINSGTSGTNEQAARVWRSLGKDYPLTETEGNHFSIDLKRGTEDKLAALSTIIPDFEKVVGGGEAPVTGAQSTVASRDGEEPPPVISEAIDRDLRNGGINVIRGGKDIGLIARYMGSLSQAANRLGNPIFKMAADRIVDTSLAIARNTRDALVGFRKEVRGNLTPQDWDKVVDLLDDPSVTKASLPANIDPKLRDSYNYTRDLLDRHRTEARDAKRLEMVAGGMTLTKAKALVPDDWGIQEGYYVHAFPGNWTITEHTGVDAKGNPIFEPITTGWRATTLTEAQGKAREYLAANPSANLKVQLDNITLPGKGITDRNRLKALHDEIKTSSMMIHNGANPDGVLAALRNTSDKLNFGPRRPAPKVYGPTLERESNLPGFVRDFDNFERYIAGMERYIQLAPARAEILKYRNAIAKGSGMPDILKVGEMPKRYSGDFHNTLGRLDASIEALEGYPTGLDSAIRHQLEKFGYDPNLLNGAYSTINGAEALLKLGFNPASAGLHLAQTIVATYPVLGERWTGYGISKAYSSKYDSLVHDLGIEATTNLLDVDTYKAYRSGYVRSVTQAGGIAEGAKGVLSTGYHDLQASGLFMFSKGVETARRVAAIGAYEKALHEGKTPQEARDYARDTLIRTQFLYNPVDTPLFMRALPRPNTQFKNFVVKMAEFMTGLRGAEVPRFMIGMGVIGYAGMPLLGALSGVVKYLFDYDPEAELKRAFPRASRGVLGLLGIDYTKNIGFSDWLGSHALDLKSLAGPAASDIGNIIKGIAGEVKGPSREGQQDIDNMVRQISPEARRLWDEGKRLASQPNLVDPRNDSLILKNLSVKERVELAAGLTPIRVAEERDTHEYIRNQIAQAKDKRGWFIDKLAELELDLSHPSLSQADRMETVKQIVSLSKLAQDYGAAYQLPKAVLERAKEMQMERLTRDIKKAPKTQRYPAYQEFKRFQADNP